MAKANTINPTPLHRPPVTEVLLGHMYRDAVTGFRGIAIAHVRYLTGCDQVCLHPGLKPDGSLAEAVYFDVNRLQCVPEAASINIPIAANAAKRGGPNRDAPGRQG